MPAHALTRHQVQPPVCASSISSSFCTSSCSCACSAVSRRPRLLRAARRPRNACSSASAAASARSAASLSPSSQIPCSWHRLQASSPLLAEGLALRLHAPWRLVSWPAGRSCPRQWQSGFQMSGPLGYPLLEAVARWYSNSRNVDLFLCMFPWCNRCFAIAKCKCLLCYTLLLCAQHYITSKKVI
jgi:hypothetical protein